jgi:hypothetical protein
MSRIVIEMLKTVCDECARSEECYSVFSDIRHFIHLEYVPEKASINQIFYVEL